MKIILYSTHCPRCGILENKLKEHGIPYETSEDVEEMKKLGIMSAPYLSVDAELMNFSTAITKLKEISYKVEEEQ